MLPALPQPLHPGGRRCESGGSGRSRRSASALRMAGVEVVEVVVVEEEVSQAHARGRVGSG